MSCSCGLPAPYEACCGVYHRGAEPADAETLMRSRFSAFVHKDAAYLYRTLHPQHDEHAQGQAAFVRKLKQHLAERIVYQRLEILDASTADASGLAKVLFRVRVMRRGKDVSFAELSYFASDGVGLRYLSGVTAPFDALPPHSATIAAFEASASSRL